MREPVDECRTIEVMKNGKPGGYSLDQLLEWCRHDRLIDSYDKLEDRVVIFQNGSRREYSLWDAHKYLKGIFTSTHRGSGSDDPNLA